MSDQTPRDDSSGGDENAGRGFGGPGGFGGFGGLRGHGVPGGPGGPGNGAGGGGGAGGSHVRTAGPGGARRPSRFGLTVAIVLVVLGVLAALSSFWTDVLWFSATGFSGVLWTRLAAQVGAFVVASLVVGALVASALVIAYRTRPIYPPSTAQQEALDRYREVIDPLRRIGLVVAPLVLGAFAGLAAASQWQTLLLWLNAQSFGQQDPTFGLDVGFFVFTLPWLQFLVSFGTMALVLTLVTATVTHYVYGGLQLSGSGPRTTKAARVHLSLLAAALVLLRAVSYWLERYELSTKRGSLITGLQYTDQNAVLPTKAILAIAALICAGLFIATIWSHSWRLPMIAVAMLVITSVVVGSLYPLAVQNLRVGPSEQYFEAEFIRKNIEATRRAYGIDGIEKQQYNAQTKASSGQLRADAATVPGIRLLDPTIVSRTFTQTQGLRRYYGFPDVLDVDRYRISGQPRDTVIAARELDLNGVPQRNWVNDHTVYTHGYGVVAAYGNKQTSDGEPSYYVRDIPPKGELGEFEPRIYFGERSTEYSIVGKEGGRPDRELDFQSAQGEQKNTYAGGGGVRMDNFLKRVAYAIKYREYRIMLSEQVGDYSTMLDHRTPRERVERVAPWLTLDGNAYPAVVDGRVQWILDGYTTSANYPYSQKQSLETATTDAVTTRAQSVEAVRAGEINYIRNSVKATVDAYSGEVKLYAWDESDPMLKAWGQAFSGTLRPMSEISAQLMSHVRYPEDLFKVQRDIITRYHITDPGGFYTGGEYWKVPEDPTSGDPKQAGLPDQPPYYLSIAMPGQENPAFSLTTSFSPVGTDRPYLTGFLAIDSDAGSEAGKRRPGYGTMRLLDLPSSTNVPGPTQVQNRIDSSNDKSDRFDLTLSQFLNLNSQGGSRVHKGNLLTLPVGGGLLYVQPEYVSGTAGSTYPRLQAVVVSFGNDIAWAATLDQALDALFKGDSGAQAGDSGVAPTPQTPGATPSPGATPTPSPSGSAQPQELKTALAEVQKQYEAGREAMKKGDWAAYGEAQKKLDTAIKRAIELQPQGGSVSVSPSSPPATPAPTASGTPTG
ncbi:UPF0182 family membrane protein [Mobilicoccus massiliensis]|uniref:UPF0182 family membrane protein n=1 Tax=Mobilicoccus massiliensis TaxID=1522310 RepID=UPI0009E1B724|nr:UPF0182 family protein [Mobilicoccus massiliensis]